MSSLPLEVVILAAGKGTRMRSARAKVLQPLAGRPLIDHVLDAAFALRPRAVHVVVGHDAPSVEAAIASRAVVTVRQGVPRGTGHAVGCALPGVAQEAVILVLYGDVPLIAPESLEPLVADAARGKLALLTVEQDDADGYGRILRRNGEIIGIVEQADATPEERRIREVNTGVMAAPAARLRAWIGRIRPNNAQGEHYLTDVVGVAHADDVAILGHAPRDPREVLGVNSQTDLARAERTFQTWQAERLMTEGLRLLDPARFDLRGRLVAGRDVVIDVGAILEGEVVLEDDVRIGAYVLLRNVRVGRGARVEAHSIVDGAHIGPDAIVGPFARVRPGTDLGAGSRVGNFVEIKQSNIGPQSKINHLSYIGDTTVGTRVNIGAGVITCNYDGANKYRTVIGDDAFVGSDCQLVAPVTIGPGATIGAGSTIISDAPAQTLTLSRTPQKSVSGWRRPIKKT